MIVRARVGGVKGPRAGGTGWRPLSGVEAKQQNGGQGKRNFPGSPPDRPSGIPEKGERKMGGAGPKRETS